MNNRRISASKVEDNLVNLRQLTFKVTDACNLKCKYCGYGELYYGYDERRNSFMTAGQVKPLLDYLCRLWKNGRPRAAKPLTYFSFYGGEPLLNIQKSWDFIKSADDSAGSQILQYLKSLTIYVGGSSGNSQWHRQTIYPTDSDEVLLKDDIINFVNKAWSNHITEISLVFSSIGDYIEIDALIEGLKKYGDKIKVRLTSEDACKNQEIVQKIVEDSDFGLVFLHSGDNYYFPAACPKERLKRVYLIQSEGEYKKASESCEKYSDINQDFVPIYNGCNGEFFRKNVLLTEKEILESNLSKREIFMHMAVNTNFFGKLTALPDRTVHADVNRPAIGTMDDSIYRLISNEMEANTAWRMTREFFRSCRNCLLRFLCPSPSSYENVMKLECICSDKIGGETRNT